MRLRSVAVVSFLWGFAEGTIFYIVPDVCVTGFALVSWRDSLKSLSAAIAGALLAGVAMYLWALLDFQSARQVVLSVPYVSEAMFSQSALAFNQDSWLAPIYAPLKFAPYKVYAVEAVNHLGLLLFIFSSFIARLWRIGSAWALASLIRIACKHSIGVRPGLLMAVHFLFWSAFYYWYWSRLEF